MAEEDEGDDGDEDELPSVDHGPLNEGPWEKDKITGRQPTRKMTSQEGNISGQ